MIYISIWTIGFSDSRSKYDQYGITLDINAKSKTSKNKNSKNYVKAYRGQGR